MNAQRPGCPINLTVETRGDRWSTTTDEENQEDDPSKTLMSEKHLQRVTVWVYEYRTKYRTNESLAVYEFC